MKPSHFQTPRTLDEATFYAGGAAIEAPGERPVQLGTVMLYVAGFILFVCAIVALLSVGK